MFVFAVRSNLFLILIFYICIRLSVANWSLLWIIVSWQCEIYRRTIEPGEEKSAGKIPWYHISTIRQSQRKYFVSIVKAYMRLHIHMECVDILDANHWIIAATACRQNTSQRDSIPSVCAYLILIFFSL